MRAVCFIYRPHHLLVKESVSVWNKSLCLDENSITGALGLVTDYSTQNQQNDFLFPGHIRQAVIRR